MYITKYMYIQYPFSGPNHHHSRVFGISSMRQGRKRVQSFLTAAHEAEHENVICVVK